jgi:Uncharacterized conserved protein
MRTYLDCIPCFFKQALNAARLAGANEDVQKKILDSLASEVPDFPLSSSPPEMGRIVYKLVREITNEEDPFKKVKDEYNKIALNIYPDLKNKVARSEDRLLTAIRLAVAGNVIDFGPDSPFDLQKEVEEILKRDFAIFDYQEFKEALESTRQILYLADNAGEVVFDRVLIEELDKEIIYVVRDKPVINDALIEDAQFCGIDEIARVVSNGSDAPGTILDLCSKDFLSLYAKAKLIISKGQGNFEGLAGRSDAPIFFLFKVKCAVIAEDIGCKVDDIILKYNRK